MARYPSRIPLQSSAGTGGVAAVDRALSLLCVFRASEASMTLADLAERTQLVKSTVLRLLASLMHFGLVRRDAEGRYSLGHEVARLGNVYASSLSLEAELMPVLRDLVVKTRESAAFHVRRGEHRLCLHRVDSPQMLRDHAQVGDLLPLDRGAGGRVLRAFSGARGAVYEKIRRDKVAAMVGDRVPDIAGISSPVFGAGGELVGALTLTLPTHRYDKAFIAPVIEAARTATQRLGGEF